MTDEGACKSARDRLTKVDVIAEDKKLGEFQNELTKRETYRASSGKMSI